MFVSGHRGCGGTHGSSGQARAEWGSPRRGPCATLRAFVWAVEARRPPGPSLCAVPRRAPDAVTTSSPGRVPENWAPPLQLSACCFSVPHWSCVPRAAVAHPSWKPGHRACSPSPAAGSAAGTGALRASARPHPVTCERGPSEACAVRGGGGGGKTGVPGLPSLSPSEPPLQRQRCATGRREAQTGQSAQTPRTRRGLASTFLSEGASRTFSPSLLFLPSSPPRTPHCISSCRMQDAGPRPPALPPRSRAPTEGFLEVRVPAFQALDRGHVPARRTWSE